MEKFEIGLIIVIGGLASFIIFVAYDESITAVDNEKKMWFKFEPTQAWKKPWDYAYQFYEFEMPKEEIIITKNYLI